MTVYYIYYTTKAIIYMHITLDYVIPNNFEV